jgi:hypothetical protein
MNLLEKEGSRDFATPVTHKRLASALAIWRYNLTNNYITQAPKQFKSSLRVKRLKSCDVSYWQSARQNIWRQE